MITGVGVGVGVGVSVGVAVASGVGVATASVPLGGGVCVVGRGVGVEARLVGVGVLARRVDVGVAACMGPGSSAEARRLSRPLISTIWRPSRPSWTSFGVPAASGWCSKRARSKY